ncbi:MAG: response regulator transcription factor [Chitinophagaceae bacterium]|jgi:DNA-binding NarL/FixJ family response regulator|nr:response regulator transcription factor [Chitinophagaceae bacterium]
MPTGVLIFDDNKSLRDSLEHLIQLSKDLLYFGSFDTAQNVRQQVSEINPDVILMDIDMPVVNGIEAVKTIRTFNQKVAILMLTVFDDNQHVLDAICAGASGYLLKKHISEKLEDAIYEVLAGGAPMSPGIARLVIQSMQHTIPEQDNKYKLTLKEKEILSSLSKGNSYKMIAADLSISIDTVRTHIKKIYEKLQVHSQTEAVSKAVNEKIV